MENNKKKLEKLLKGSEDAFIIATKNGVATVGYSHEILTLLTALVRAVKTCKGVAEENIDTVFRLSKMNDEELKKETLKKIKELIEKMGNKNEK